jgi:hypothetical protein
MRSFALTPGFGSVDPTDRTPADGVQSPRGGDPVDDRPAERQRHAARTPDRRGQLRRSLGLATAIACAGCPKPVATQRELPRDPVTGGEADPRTAMIAELQDDIFDSYERDDPPEIRTDMLPSIAGTGHKVGTARIGVGPMDMWIGDEVAHAASRWPLVVDRDASEARSKRLDIHLAQDGSAAWMFDELSWRIKVCGRIAVVPLRITALYAHDGDRWVPVFEHLSFGHQVVPARQATRAGKEIRSEVVARDVADAISEALNPVLAGTLRDPNVVAINPDALVLGPDVGSEWHGPSPLGGPIVDGKLTTEARRIGTIGRTVAASTIAYWVGTLIAEQPATPTSPGGKARLRGSFVFEKRKITMNTMTAPDPQGHVEVANATTTSRWVLVQAHVSQPIAEDDLATLLFGTSLLSVHPLRLSCDDAAAPPAAR